MKKFLFFVLCCLTVNIGHAENYITYDSLAMETAAREIKKIGSNSSYKSVDDAVVALVNSFEKSVRYDDTVDIDKVMDDCVKIIVNTRTCTNFVNTYNKYLDHANFCKYADNFKTGKLSFIECREYVLDNDTSYAKHDSSGTSYKKCQQWIEAGLRCRFYLINYYTDKSNSAESDKTYYECLLKKLWDGDIDFPVSKMEKSCKI